MRPHTIVVYLALLTSTLLFFAGCKKGQTEKTNQAGSTLGGASGSVAGIRWSVPKRWIEQAPRPMRAASYSIPAAEGETEGGECTVFYFGNEQGGTVNANIERWSNQFETSGAPARSTTMVNDLKVTVARIAGTYLTPGGPAMQSQGKKEN